jgi:hypothetical protein
MARKGEGYSRYAEPDWNALDSDGNDEEDYQQNSALSFNDQKTLHSMTKKIQEQFDFLTEDEIQSAILENNFDQEKINKYLEKYSIDEKYQGIEAYEWKQVENKPFVNKKRGKGGRGNANPRHNRQYQDTYNQGYYNQPYYGNEEYGYNQYEGYEQPYKQGYQDSHGQNQPEEDR